MWLTAWQALVEMGDLQPGQTVLIHGGSGGVGTVAIQLAKHLGATVATTASATNADLVRELGADIVIDYASEDFAERSRSGGSAPRFAAAPTSSASRTASSSSGPTASTCGAVRSSSTRASSTRRSGGSSPSPGPSRRSRARWAAATAARSS